MGLIQSVLYKQTVEDLYKASALYSTADYDEALAVLLRQLPLTEEKFISDTNIRHGFALLSRTYMHLIKTIPALESLQKYNLSADFPLLAVSILLKRKQYTDVLELTLASTDNPLEQMYLMHCRIVGFIYCDLYEEALHCCRALLNTIEAISFDEWVVIRSGLFDLIDREMSFSQEAQETSLLVQKEYQTILDTQWYSSRPVTNTWKEQFIEEITGRYAPRPIELDALSQINHALLFPQPIPIHFEWALNKLLAHLDDIPEPELSKTLHI